MPPEPFLTIMLDFSGLYDQECFGPDGAVRVLLQDLDGVDCYCDPESAAQIRDRLRDLPVRALHWIDGGDYHYATLFWLEKIRTPFALVLIDNHPDDQPTAFGGDLLSCGGWVVTARERLPFLKETVWVRDAAHSLPEIPPDLPLYLSLDLDALSGNYARTNWDQGAMTLPQLRALLDALAKGHEIIGIDICGGLTEAQGATGEDFTINRRTRAELQELCLSLQAK